MILEGYQSVSLIFIIENSTSSNCVEMYRKEIINTILVEKNIYRITLKRRIWGWITLDSQYRIWRWLYNSRKADYYSQFYNKSFLYKVKTLYYLRKKNHYGEKLGLDIDTKNIGNGLLIYHPGATVINGNARIGENCTLHGNNCIGNKGPAGSPCPTIGNNVEIGVGAKVIGDVTIADNITIGAGAVVIHSFTEEGITIGGVPAKRIN